MIREASIVQVMSAAAVQSMKTHRHVDASAEVITASRRAKRAAGKFLESSMHVSKRTPVNMLIGERGESQQVSKLIQRVYHSIST